VGVVRLGFRWRPKLGWFRFNFGKRGYTSTSVRKGWWSWNSRTKKHRVDLPGPFHVEL
jgi:hypothetical protein